MGVISIFTTKGEHIMIYETIIIGAGFAGYTAAIYAARYTLKTLLIAKTPGGTILDAHNVENYPGFPSISGFELMQNFKKHTEKFNIPMVIDEVKKIEKQGKLFSVKTEKGEYSTKTVIFAMGSRRRKLNLPDEGKYIGRGLAYCATCDAPFFKDKVVGVVGGSDAAVQAALLLSQYAKRVYVIYRRDKLRAEPITVKQLESLPKVGYIFNTNVVGLEGDPVLKKVHFDTGKSLELDGLFIEIGSVPSTDLAKSLGVKLNEANEIIVDELSRTNVKGVYAAGDVTDRPLKQGVAAAGYGATAAYAAYNYIKKGD